MAEITGLLLAAGQSRRFGGNKLLAHYRHRPLILHSAASLAPCDRVIAVVRADDTDLQTLLEKAGVETVINTQADQGMGSSIACGIKASNDSCGWCILPADMPNVPSRVTQLLMLALHNDAALAAPYYQGMRGHPVGFHRSLAGSLQTLDGDRGARSILEQHSVNIMRLDVDAAGILEDIDTPRELAHINSRQPASARPGAT